MGIYLSFVTARARSITATAVRTQSGRQMFKSIGSLAGANLAGALISAVGGVLAARYVEPEIYGKFRLFTIPLMYLTFLNLGTFDGLYRQLPFHIGRDRPDHAEKLAAATGAWNLWVTLVVALGFLCYGVSGFLHGSNVDGAGWLSQALFCAFLYYGGYLGATYRTLNNFVVLARIQLAHSIVNFCLVITVFYWGFYGLCLRTAISALFALCLYNWARPLRMPLHFDFTALKEVVKVGMPYYFWGALYFPFWLAVEYSLMLRFGGLKAVGLFSVAVVLREGLSILPQAVYQVLTPRAIENYARQGGVWNATRRSFQAAGALTFLMAVVACAISPVLNYCVPLFIPQYTDGLQLFKVCLWLAVIHAVGLPINGLIANGRSWLYGKGVLAGLVTFPLAVYLLNPLIGGMMAVAAGSLIGRFTRTVVAYLDLIMLIRRESPT